MEINDLIARLGLEPLNGEGGYYRETYRSDESVSGGALPSRYGSERQFSTAMYYLLTPDMVSAMHRVASDEVFHFYLGEPVTMLLLHPDGRQETVVLGPDIESGQRPQVVVYGGVWQGAFLTDGGGFALMGATVAPAFDFRDFELGGREELVRRYPESESLIERLTPR